MLHTHLPAFVKLSDQTVPVKTTGKFNRETSPSVYAAAVHHGVAVPRYGDLYLFLITLGPRMSRRPD